MMMERLEFHLTYTCPQACVFCSEEDRMKAFKDHPVSLQEVARVLALKWKEGFRHVTFTGGEPTIYPRFWNVLRCARKLGYATYITTNGNTLAFEGYARKALPYLSEICFSVHGPDAKIHDGATGDKGSFALLHRALQNVEAFSAETYVLVNFVVTPKNIDSLTDTLEFVGQFRKVRHFLVSNLASEGGGKHRYLELAVPLERIGREAPKLAQVADKRGIVLRFFGVPACVLGTHKRLSNDFHWSPRATIERGRDRQGRVGLVEIRGWTPTRGRVQTEKCAPCSYRRCCPGIFERYRREFGDGELKPVLSGELPAGLKADHPLQADQQTAFWLRC